MSEPNFDACCDHCGCPPSDRIGHDDTCRFGCNDEISRCVDCGRPMPSGRCILSDCFSTWGEPKATTEEHREG